MTVFLLSLIAGVRLELDRAAHVLTGGPGPARANHHGGLTVVAPPATAGHIIRFPSDPQKHAEGARQ